MTSLRGNFACILVIISIILLFYSLTIKAEQASIRNETERYQKQFKITKDYRDICKGLESYGEYIAKSLAILNAQFEQNRQLYRKIEKYGTFEKNNQVTLSNVREEEVKEYNTYLSDNGIKVGYSEGNIYLFFDPLYVVNNFRDVLPSKILEYYAIEAEDINEGFAEDSALRIPWDVLREKIIRYENYCNAVGNADCPYIIKLTKQKLRQHLNAYMLGLDNSPIYGPRIAEARRSFEKFLINNRDSRLFNIIKDYYSVLAKNDFKFGRKEGAREGRRYVSFTISTDKNEEIPIEVLVDRYVKQADSLLCPR